MAFASLSAWLEWLENCHPREIDLGLDRIRQVAQRMNLLSPTAKIVVVGGTNGKGSCVTATAALLRAAGYSVGVYTSPHLHHYNERVVVDGAAVDDQSLCDSFARIQAACYANPPSEPISLTYFEFGTLAALDIFRQRQVDVMVLEVGLGGRLDAVNLMDADVSVVTSVDIDHRDWLGDNREDIGYEKAGIYRSGQPALCADPAPPARLLQVIAQLHAEPCLINQGFGFAREGDQHWCWWGSAGRFEQQPLPSLPLPSLAAALEVVSRLGVAITDESFQLLAGLQVPGRFQRLQWQERQLILDVAHNPAATRYLAAGVSAWKQAHPQAQVFAAVAMMSDKDRPGSLGNLQGLIDTWLLVDLSVPRAATSEQLGKNLQDMGVMPAFSGTMAACLQTLLRCSQAGDLLLVFGSFFTVAAALDELDQALLVDGE